MSKQGEFIKSARRKCGLTQKQLADKLNVSDKVISKWEVGDSFPDYTLLPELAKQLNVEINEILNGEFQQKKTAIDGTQIQKNITNNNVVIVSNNIKEKSSDNNTLKKSLIDELNLEDCDVSCTKCGSGEIEIFSDDFGRCKHCGAMVQLKKFTLNETTNNFNNYYNTNNAKSLSNIYYVEGNLTAKEFYRYCCITLSFYKNSPIDILEKCSFGKIYIYHSQFVIANVKFDGYATATIGYDRKEEYTAYEKEWKNGRSYEVPVKKTRTVTDWQPFNTTISSTELCCASIGKTNNEDSDMFLESFYDLKGFSNIIPFEKCEKKDIKIETPSEKELDRATWSGENNLKAKVKFPGDKVKNENINVNHNILSQEQYIIPTYKMNYNFNGKQYEIRSFKTKYNSMGDTPPDMSNEINTEIDKKTKTYSIISNFSSIIAFIFSLLLMLVIKNKGLIWLDIVLLCISVICFVLYKVKRKKFSDAIYLEKQHIKRTKLNAFLKAHNLATLTKEESDLFEGGK